MSAASPVFVRRAARLLTVVPLVAAALGAAPAFAAGPPPLSRETTRADISSRDGSGIFGTWRPDRFGLPAYRYTLDPDRDPRAAQPERGGRSDAWHQLGNDHVVATAHNRGWVQLWSQDRRAQWLNRAEPESGHYAGGYGYLRAGERTISTLYADRPRGARSERIFGAGAFARRTTASGMDVREEVYAPFGNDGLLLHDVTITNTSRSTLRASWFEYWDVNPYAQQLHRRRGLKRPAFDPATRTLSVAQARDALDRRPLTIFAAALRGPVKGWETDKRAFFGAGGRASPADVGRDRLDGGVAPAVTAGGGAGDTLFALRTPVRLAPGASVTLRYAYGAAHPAAIRALVARYRRARAPLARSQAAWRRWLPQATLGSGRSWLSRELQWDAYLLRSGTTYDEGCGAHLLSQGGYHQYDLGVNAAYRDPLQHVLPLVYAAPQIARDVVRYSAAEQPRGDGFIPYAMGDLCRPVSAGNSDDLDLWLLLTASELGLADRDRAFFDEPVRWRDGGRASLWAHLRRAFANQERLRGPHGGYLTADDGDWSDFSRQFLGMTESLLVSAQAAYVYPRVAELAELRGDRAFAASLRRAAAELRAVLRREWTGRGWFARGYRGDERIGSGAIFGEPQPWAMLAGVATAPRARTLVANVRRFLTGVGAPPGLRGPSRIGSSQSPARDDPAVGERTPGFEGVGGNNAVYVGGTWYAVDGWLTWALGSLDGVVPRAGAYALDELQRNTLRAHARAFPAAWDGVISVDDACAPFFAPDPSRCGVGLFSAWNTQLMHQPSWTLFDVIKLAGVQPRADGYRIAPSLPLSRFSVRLPQVGVAYEPRVARGYVRPAGPRTVRMTVELPARGEARRARAYVEGRSVPATRSGRSGRELVFTLRARRGAAIDWAVVA